MQLNDSVTVDISSGTTTTFAVQYDDYNRRLIINPRNFAATDVNVFTNTITIPNHNFREGQKIVYTSSSPSLGLTNEGIYYIIIVDSNKIKLSNSYYEATIQNPIEIEINSQSFGSILPINPSTFKQ